MSRAAHLAVAIAVAAALAGCGAPADPHAATEQALFAAYEPLSTCVGTALKDRSDFDGNLGAFVVRNGLDAQLQALSTRYLGTAADVAAMDEAGRVAASNETMLALARFAASPAQGAERVKRTMAMVEAMALTATATGVDCEPSEDLETLMKKAEHEYL